MTQKAVNLSKAMQDALKTPPAEVLHLNTQGTKYIAKDSHTGWDVAGRECLERHKYLNERNEVTFKLPGHVRDSPLCAAKWLVTNFGLIDWGESNAFPSDASGGTIDVPSGWFSIPGTDIGCFIDWSSRDAPRIKFQFPNLRRPVIDAIMAGITDEQKNHSIFRGKAISIDQNLAFFNPSDGNTLVFDERTEEFIEVQILNKITKRKQLKAKGRTLKMGILLEGPYGCGKTALAQYIAALAIKHDLTFLYVKDPDAYEAVLNILKNYDNCIVLLEDLDRLAGDIDKIANWLDAVDTKGDDTMSIFTTNHGEVVRARMPKIMRTGRIGDTITIKLPGRREREQLFNLYCRQNGQSLAIIGDINPAIDESEGLNGSAIAHICETAIQFAESYDADMENGLDSKYLALAASYNAQYNARIAEWDVMNTKKDAPTIDTLLRAMLDGVDNPKTHVPLPDILESARKYLAQKEEESVDSICEHMDMKFHELRSRPNK